MISDLHKSHRVSRVEREWIRPLMLVDGLHGRIMLDPRIRPPLRLVRVVVESLEYAPRRLLLVLHYFFEGGIVVHAGHDILSPMVVVI